MKINIRKAFNIVKYFTTAFVIWELRFMNIKLKRIPKRFINQKLC